MAERASDAAPGTDAHGAAIASGRATKAGIVAERQSGGALAAEHPNNAARLSGRATGASLASEPATVALLSEPATGTSLLSETAIGAALFSEPPTGAALSIEPSADAALSIGPATAAPPPVPVPVPVLAKNVAPALRAVAPQETVAPPTELATRRLPEPRVIVAGGFLFLLLAAALAAPLIAPHDPLEQDLMLNTLPPAWNAGAEPGYWLGTDSLGRDVLSRMIFATRIALTVALVAAFAAGAIGTMLGLLAGWFGGAVDAVICRLVDIWMAFPPVLLSILLVAVLGTGLTSVIVAIVVIDWTRFCRVVRSETLQQARMEYVDAAVILGASRWTILWREVFPNVVPVIVVLLSLEMGIAVIVEAVLSFVGLSVSSDTPTWGGMIAEGRQIIHQGWWVMVFPLVLLTATVLAFNQFGDGLRRLVDPVLRR